jgi:hypothetical protein
MDVSALRADDARGGPASKPLDVEKGRDRSVELRRLPEERRVVADLTAQIPAQHLDRFRFLGAKAHVRLPNPQSLIIINRKSSISNQSAPQSTIHNRQC